MKHVAASLLLIAWAWQAQAEAPRVQTEDVLGARAAIEAQGNQFTISEEPGSDIERLYIAHAQPETFHHQFTTQAAIGADGPWQDIELKADSMWESLPVIQKQEEVVIVLTRHAPDGVPEMVFDGEIKPTGLPKHYGEHKQMGGGTYLEDCKAADGQFDPRVAPCYLYHAVDRFKFVGTDEQEYIITLTHPGGC